jgi:Nucleotidyl transferase AbiEii toxin, Type IV TA system
LTQITEALRQTAERLQAKGFQTRATADASETKLLIRRGGIEVKVEANFVMRGTLYPVQRASLTKAAQDLLLADLELPMASMEDVYGGKLVAAIDRPHPRDLFDVMPRTLVPSATRSSHLRQVLAPPKARTRARKPADIVNTNAPLSE